MVYTRAGIKRKQDDTRLGDDEPSIKVERDENGTESESKSFRSSLKRFHFVAATDVDTTSPSTSTDRAPKVPHQAFDISSPKSKSETSVSPAKKLKKKKRPSSSYAPPSTYSHLPLLTDVITPNLIVLFVGTNPGVRTATAGHAYAHPSNLFWRLLHSSGCTDRRLDPSEDIHLPRLYAMGNTNIVSRPTKDAGELSKAEMAAGAPILDEKVSLFRPESVCIVGKGIWEAVWRHKHGKNPSKDEFRYGWQNESERMGRTTGTKEAWNGAPVFVASSTSGLAASLGPREKEEIWRPFGEWVKARREERMKLGMENPTWVGASRFITEC